MFVRQTHGLNIRKKIGKEEENLVSSFESSGKGRGPELRGGFST
jgi:hypothetical protein